MHFIDNPLESSCCATDLVPIFENQSQTQKKRYVNAKEKEVSQLASQGEFLKGAGNALLVMTVFATAGALLVLRRSAQPA